MKSLVYKYRYVVLASFKSKFVYSVWLWVGLINVFIQTLFFYYFWGYFNSGGDSGLISYVVIARIVYLIVGSSSIWAIGEEIYSGKIVLSLTKPVHFPLLFFYRYIGEQFASILAQGIATFGLMYIFFDLKVVSGNILYFFISIMMSWIILFLIDFLFSFICFISHNMWGITAFREGLLQMLSGALIPLSLFPEWLAKVNDFLPFQYVIHTPIKILVYQVEDVSVLLLLAKQFTCIAVLLALVLLLWNRVRRKLTIQGG